jgi:hypothetical protein
VGMHMLHFRLRLDVAEAARSLSAAAVTEEVGEVGCTDAARVREVRPLPGACSPPSSRPFPGGGASLLLAAEGDLARRGRGA